MTETPVPHPESRLEAAGEGRRFWPPFVIATYRRFRAVYPELGFWIGIVGLVYFWVAVVIDGYLNSSWWQFTGNSFSALGDPSPNSTGAAAGLYWIYNDVVIFPTAFLILLFAAALIMASRNRIQETGGAFLMVGGIFLALVGIYHGGPPTPAGYHDFVSMWFFVQAALGILIYGIGLLWQRKMGVGLANVVLIIAALAIGFSVKFGSVAETEAFGIVAIDIWVLLMFFTRRPSIQG